MAFLSIITVNFNNRAGLQKTIESVIRQSWQHFEYVIIDGASTDESVLIIKDLESTINEKEKKNYESPRFSFKWISEPDKGVYQAMNKGIGMAQGKYLLFLNSGDFLVNKNVLDALFTDKKYSEDILCTRCNVSKNGKVVWTSNLPEEITFGKLYLGGLAHQSTFIKRSLFEKYGLYREDFRYHADIDFWFKTIIQGNCSTRSIQTVVADYNLDGMSSKSQSSKQFKKERDEILKPFSKFIPDYDRYQEKINSMHMYFWVKKHKLLNKFITLLYKLATKIHQN